MKHQKLSLRFLRDFKRDYRQLIYELIADKGDAFKLPGPTYDLHIFVDPTFSRRVLFENYLNYVRTPNKVVSLLDDPHLSAAESNERWIKMRGAMLNPLTTEHAVRKYAGAIAENTKQLLKPWDEYVTTQERIPTYYAIKKIAIANLAKTLLGDVKLDYDYVIQVVDQVLALFIAAELSITKLPWILPTPTRRKTYRVMHELLNIGDKVLDHCLAPNAPPSILSEIAKNYGAAYRDGSLNQDMRLFLRSVITAFIFGGFDTITRSLTLTHAYLSTYPHVVEAVSQEIKTHIGEGEINENNVTNLHYTQAVILESLRHAGGVMPILLRQALADDKIGDYIIKKNDRVLIPVFYLHRLPQYWQNPEGFLPQHFMNPLDERYRFIYLPFGNGPRACIGRNFAILQSTVVLATMLQRYRFYLSPPQTINSDLPAQITMTAHAFQSSS